MNVVSFDLPSGELLGLHGDLGGIQGNLLKGIDKKTVKGLKTKLPRRNVTNLTVWKYLKLR